MTKITISIKEMQKMMVISEDKAEFAESWIHIIEKGFKWNEFILHVKELTQSYKVQITGYGEDQTIKIKKIQYDDYGLTTNVSRYEVNVLEYVERLKDFIISGTKDTFKELYKKSSDFVDIVPPMSFMQYMIIEEKKRAYEYIETKPSTPKNTSKSCTPQKHKEYTLLEAIKIYSQTPSDEKRTYNRHTSGWDVSGGFRHYKSGKVVWIAPYPKGTNRINKSNDSKQYKLKED